MLISARFVVLLRRLRFSAQNFFASAFRSRALWIALGYAALASLWIYFSDAALGVLFSDPEQVLRWSVVKGVAFVALTALLLFFQMRWAFGAIETGYRRLKAQETETHRLNRLYMSLNRINQVIAWAESPDELLRQSTQALVEQGRFLMAWAGWHDPATSQITPVAQWGDDRGYLARTKIYADDRPEGRGPTGQAFRTGRPYVCNDFLADPATLPWRAEAARHRIRGAAAFPLVRAGQVIGTLTVYADEPGVFQTKEVSLLTEAARDVSFALDYFLEEEQRRTLRTTLDREKLFSETMIESMPGIVYFYNEERHFLRWNRNFVTLSGYSPEEIARMQPLDFFAPEDRARVAARIAEVFTRGESWGEAPFIAKDGRATPYFFTGRRIDYDGQPCLVGVGVDLSERKRTEEALRESERRYRTTLDGMMEGCQIIGHDWRYLYLNEAASRHNRRPNHELLGRTMPEAWPGIERTPVFALLRRCLESRVAAHEEVEFTFRDGAKGWFDVRCQPVPEGIFVLSLDVSARKSAELALRDSHQALEREVAQRTEQLRAALVRAEAADRLKSAFLATMSHEFRTPLNSIIGFTGLLLQGLAGPLIAEQTKQLGLVRDSARHLLELINDVLDISKIEAGQLEVRAESFDLRASIERVMTSLQPLAHRKGLILGAALPPVLPAVISDRRRVEQILLNLLNNALKFTERGSVTLSADLLPDPPSVNGTSGASAIRLRVVDTGIGIHRRDFDQLFQPFRQIDSGLARQHKGTGLGLAICRRLAGLLGGEIEVDSEWGVGSTFTFTFPLVPPARA